MNNQQNFNRLTPAQTERLAILSEECGEVATAVGKILRHGYENEWLESHNRPSNRSDLMLELADLQLAIGRLIAAGDINQITVEFMMVVKDKAEQYLHHLP